MSDPVRDLIRTWRERGAEEFRHWPASSVGTAYGMCADELEAALNAQAPADAAPSPQPDLLPRALGLLRRATGLLAKDTCGCNCGNRWCCEAKAAVADAESLLKGAGRRA